MPTIQERLQAIYARKRMQQQLAAQTSQQRQNQTRVTGRPIGMPKGVTPTQMRAAIKGKSAFANRKEQPRQFKSSQSISSPPKRTWWQLVKRKLVLKKAIKNIDEISKGKPESKNFTPSGEGKRVIDRFLRSKPKPAGFRELEKDPERVERWAERDLPPEMRSDFLEPRKRRRGGGEFSMRG